MAIPFRGFRVVNGTLILLFQEGKVISGAGYNRRCRAKQDQMTGGLCVKARTGETKMDRDFSEVMDKPNPSVVVRQILEDGAEVQVIWSWLSETKEAKLVTVYLVEQEHESAA